MNIIKSTLIISTLLLSSLAIAMGDKPQEPSDNNAEEMPIDEKFAHGKKSHKNHCYKCHTDDIYTRDESFIKSIDALSKQVVRCKDGSDIPWFDEDTETVIHFVNKKYYKF